VTKIEKTFTVAVPVGRAWEVFTDGAERSKWEAVEYEIDPTPGGRVRWTLPGIEAVGRVEEVVAEKLLRTTEGSGPHANSEITVTFESVGGGTRISITHAGFGDAADWDEWIEGTNLGWSQAIADLIVYLETGVPARRFTTAMQPPGMRMADTPAGVVVERVEPAGLASRAGLEPGDILLTVGGAPIYSIAELWVLLREHSQGTRLAIDYIRNGERHTATGTLAGVTWPGS